MPEIYPSLKEPLLHISQNQQPQAQVTGSGLQTSTKSLLTEELDISLGPVSKDHIPPATASYWPPFSANSHTSAQQDDKYFDAIHKMQCPKP